MVRLLFLLLVLLLLLVRPESQLGLEAMGALSLLCLTLLCNWVDMECINSYLPMDH